MCIVPSLQSQLESHSSLHTVQTPAHLVWQLQGDLHALTKIHTCTRKCWHKNKHKHTAAHKVPWYPKAHNLLADHAFIVETGLSGWSALKCERLHTFSTQSHTHRTHTKALSCFACDLLAILHLAEVATSSADPALQLRDTGIAFCSTSSRIPQAQKAAELSISTYEGLIYQLEGLKCTAPFI